MDDIQQQQIDGFYETLARITEESGFEHFEAYALMMYFALQGTAKEKGLKEAWGLVVGIVQEYGNLGFSPTKVPKRP